MTDAGPGAPLRVLIVIAMYPPHHLGGYELRCRDTARELARRGHEVTVVTSDLGEPGVTDDEGVRLHRILGLWREGVFGRKGTWRFVRRTARDMNALRAIREQARPDVVYFWHLAGLSSALFALERPPGCGVFCDVSSVWLLDVAGTGGNWFRLWEKRAGAAWKRLGKSLFAAWVRAVLDVPTERPPWPPGRCSFTSDDLVRRYREADIAIGEPRRLVSGVDLDRFAFVGDRDWDGPITLLFLSRVKRFKGLHTAVKALARLPERYRLRAVGAVDEPEYLEEVRGLVADAGLEDRFTLEDQVAHAEIPAVMASGHVLIFGSEGPEAFSRMVLEAFAVGTPVVGTTLGGTAKVLHDGETGIVFAPGDDAGQAAGIRRIVEDAALRECVIANARELVRSTYSLAATVTQIEGFLRDAVAEARA